MISSVVLTQRLTVRTERKVTFDQILMPSVNKKMFVFVINFPIKLTKRIKRRELRWLTTEITA